MFRSEKWLQAVTDVGFCLLCGTRCVQVSHRSEVERIGLKCDDSLTAAICPECNNEIVNGKELSSKERIALMDEAIVLTIKHLARKGVITVNESISTNAAVSAKPKNPAQESE